MRRGGVEGGVAEGVMPMGWGIYGLCRDVCHEG